MRKKDVIKKLVAGGFFVGCIVMLVVVIFVIGLQRGFNEEKFKMVSLFRNIGGLNTGAPVRLSGVTVGTVADIGFLDQDVEGRGVKVSMNIYKKFQKQLYKSTKVAIVTEGVLGEKIIAISITPGYKRVSLTEPIIGEDPLDVQDLAQTFGEVADALLASTENIETVISQMGAISLTAKRLLNRVEQRVIDGTLFKVF